MHSNFSLYTLFTRTCSIKLGVIEDQSNRSRLAPLLRFLSSHSTTNVTSLEDYISRMKEKQVHKQTTGF